MRVEDKETGGCLRGSVLVADFASSRDLMAAHGVLKETRALLIHRDSNSRLNRPFLFRIYVISCHFMSIGINSKLISTKKETFTFGT